MSSSFIMPHNVFIVMFVPTAPLETNTVIVRIISLNGKKKLILHSSLAILGKKLWDTSIEHPLSKLNVDIQHYGLTCNIFACEKGMSFM